MVDSRKQDPLYVITANVQGNCDNSWKLRNVFDGPESLSSRKKKSINASSRRAAFHKAFDFLDTQDENNKIW